MPAADKMLLTLRKALELVRATPGRIGRSVQVPEARDVLIAGDLHGQVKTFKKIFQLADLGRNPQRHLILQEVVHGPHRYADGSDRSHQLVDLYAALVCQYPGRVHYLPGNHEMAQATGREIGKGEKVEQNRRFRQGVDFAYGSLAAEIYDCYCQLFLTCPLLIRFANRLAASHTVPKRQSDSTWDATVVLRDATTETEMQPGGAAYAIVWGRDISEANVDIYRQQIEADYLVTGHIPTELGYESPSPRHLIVDSARDPAAVVLLPADRPLNPGELLTSVRVISAE